MSIELGTQGVCRHCGQVVTHNGHGWTPSDPPMLGGYVCTDNPNGVLHEPS